MLAEFFFPTDNVVDLPVECLLIFAFGLSPFSGPFRMLGRVVIVVFVPFIIWVEVHLIFKSERKFDNRIDIGVQFVFHIFTISVQVIEERIFSIIVARRIHSVWTIRIIDFICCKRRIVRTLSYIGRQCTFILRSERRIQTYCQEIRYLRLQVQPGAECFETVTNFDTFAIGISHRPKIGKIVCTVRDAGRVVLLETCLENKVGPVCFNSVQIILDFNVLKVQTSQPSCQHLFFRRQSRSRSRLVVIIPSQRVNS